MTEYFLSHTHDNSQANGANSVTNGGGQTSASGGGQTVISTERTQRNKKPLYDFHTHSTASDGFLSPRALIQKARGEDVAAIALTDHDTVSGIDEGRTAAREAGVQFIAGIELNIEWHPGEFHLLGLGLKDISRSMEEIIAASRRTRQERNEKIAALMKADGVAVDLSSLEHNAADGNDKILGRPHFADYVVTLGMAATRQEAFDKYFGRGRRWYAERAGANLDEAVQAIADSGGIPIIAHPMSLHVSWGHLDKVLDDIKERGVEGVEAWHPTAREADCRRLERMAHERGLLVSAGSDYHGAPSASAISTGGISGADGTSGTGAASTGRAGGKDGGGQDNLSGAGNKCNTSGGSMSEKSYRRLAHSSNGHCITSSFIDSELLERLCVKVQ